MAADRCERQVIVADWASEVGKGKFSEALVIGCNFSKQKYSVVNEKGV